MKWRVATFVTVTAIAIASYAAYDRFHVRGRLYPPEDLITDTPYGPILFLLIPLSLGWVFLGAQRRWVRAVGVCVALVILLIFAVVIAAVRHTFVDMR